MQGQTSNVPPEKLQGAGGTPPPAGFDGYGGYPPQPQHASYQQQTPYPPAGASSGYPPQQQQWGAAAPYGQQPQQQQQQWGAAAPYAQQPQQQQWGAPAANGMPVPPPGPPPRNNTIGSGSYTVNIDPDTAVAQKFAETVVRNGFVRKVFGIVSVQLAFTVGIACIFLFNNELKFYVRRNQWVFWTAWALAFAMLMVISCVEKARRSFPTNMVLLGVFTAVQAFLVGTMTAFYDQQAVIIAFAVTSAAVIAITIFAINTKIDVTRWGTLLLVALVAFIVLLIIGLFWVNKILYLVLSGIACLLFSAYLLYDIQLVMGGRYYSISPDEYIFAALNIYLDIVNLFIWMLSLIGLASSNN